MPRSSVPPVVAAGGMAKDEIEKRLILTHAEAVRDAGAAMREALEPIKEQLEILVGKPAKGALPAQEGWVAKIDRRFKEFERSWQIERAADVRQRIEMHRENQDLTGKALDILAAQERRLVVLEANQHRIWRRIGAVARWFVAAFAPAKDEEKRLTLPQRCLRIALVGAGGALTMAWQHIWPWIKAHGWGGR